MENKQEKGKKIKFLIALVVFSLVYYILIWKNKIDLSMLINKNDLSNHFNFITVNSVFVGFLFSSLSLILGLSSIESIIRLERGGFMSNIYENIIYGITFSFLSIICSLIMIFMSANLSKFTLLINVLVPSVELLGLLLTIIVFFKAVIDVKFIIKVVRNNIKKTNIKEEDLKKTLELLKK